MNKFVLRKQNRPKHTFPNEEKLFGLFMLPLKHILKNKINLQRNFYLSENSIDNWPYWMFEEHIKIVNEIVEEENKKRKEQEEQQSKSMGGNNFNADSMMKNAQNMTKGISKN